MTSYKKLKKPLAPQACPIYIAATGSLAQLVERFVYTEDVGSSSLSRPTIYPSHITQMTDKTDRAGRALFTCRKDIFILIKNPREILSDGCSCRCRAMAHVG